MKPASSSSLSSPLLFSLCVLIAFSPFLSAKTSSSPSATSSSSSLLQEETNRTSITVPRQQNPKRNGTIAFIVGRVLENLHFKQQRYTDEISQAHLKNYMEALDYGHLVFLESDYQEFKKQYGNSLDEATAQHDTSPAFIIYDRFLQRMEERGKLIETLIEKEYDFSIDEKFRLDREKAYWPQTEAQVEELWRKRIKYELLNGRLNKETEEETKKRIAKRYRNQIKEFRNFEESDIIRAYLNALTQAYDPHSDYFTKDDAENFGIHAIDLKLTGIGAVLRYDDGYSKIENLVPGGPAALSKKLNPGDRIVAVAQGGKGEPVDVIDMKLRKVVQLIRGKQGTKVRLTIIPADAPDNSVREEITLIRDEIKLTEQQAQAKIYEVKNTQGKTQRIGVISLPQFYANTSSHVKKLLTSLQKENVSGIILDLRNNGGGLLDQAIDLTGLFIPSGPVVQVKNHEGHITQLTNTSNQLLYSGPLIVLVSHLSASASEIVAAALQDYGRALIVGDSSTHGKGTVQTLLPLNRWMGFGLREDPGQLKITVQKFYRIAGGSTQERGVIPDIQLPSVFDYYDIGERTLPNHLPWDQVSPASYKPFEQMSHLLPQLKTNSTARISQDPEFAYILEDIELFQKKQKNKTISLHEAQRRAEKAEHISRKEQRKKERISREKTKADLVYQLTIEMIDQGKAATLFDPSLEKKETNLTSEKIPSSSDPSSKEKEETIPVDPHLDETINIMLDYTRKLRQPSLLAQPS